nr:hypothetical protein BaRGS_002786 [Batillaria attramentaria]
MSTWRTYNATSAQEPLVLPRDIADNFTPLEINFIIINCVLTPILLLVGVPANIISCLVFYKQGLRDRMNLCLFVLALVDMMVVNFSFLVFGMRATSGCITMVIAVERCVCVVFPLRANSIMRTRTMGALLAITFIIMHLGFSVMFFRNKVESVYDKTRDQVLYRVTPREGFRKYNFILWDIVYTIIFSFVVPIVTFVVVGVATAVTVIKLRTAIAWRASTSSGGGADNQNQQQQVALTKMLVILSGVFMVCTAPLTSLSIVRLLLPDFSSYAKQG